MPTNRVSPFYQALLSTLIALTLFFSLLIPVVGRVPLFPFTEESSPSSASPVSNAVVHPSYQSRSVKERISIQEMPAETSPAPWIEGKGRWRVERYRDAAYSFDPIRQHWQQEPLSRVEVLRYWCR